MEGFIFSSRRYQGFDGIGAVCGPLVGRKASKGAFVAVSGGTAVTVV